MEVAIKMDFNSAVHQEFSLQYEKVYKELGIFKLLEACNRRSLFRTIKTYEKYLDSVIVEQLSNRRLVLVKKIFSGFFFKPPREDFWQGGLAVPNQLTTVTLYLARLVDAQMIKNILRIVMRKVKDGTEGKIIVPDGYFYFIYRVNMSIMDRDKFYDFERVIKTKDFHSAIEFLKRKIYQATACDFRAYYDGCWHNLKLTKFQGIWSSV